MRSVGFLCVLLVSGCYAEIAGGYHKIDQEGGTVLPAGDEVKGTGWYVGANVGLALDFFKFTRVAVGYTMETPMAKTEMDGSVFAAAKGLLVRVDQKLMDLGSKNVFAVTGAFAKGGGDMRYKPDGGTEVKDTDGDGMALFLGGTLGLYQNSELRYSPWSYHLSAGLGYSKVDSPTQGEVSTYGPQVRLSITYGNQLIGAFRGGGGGGGGGGGSTSGANQGAFQITMDDDQNYATAIAQAMQTAGCQVQQVNEYIYRGTCGSNVVAVVQSGRDVAVACEGPGMSDQGCRDLVSSMLK